jgi:histidine phosphotransferase ChpT
VTDTPARSDRPTIGLDVALLLCTRLCHDLAGPIGAVNTGAELLEEEGMSVDAETLDLLASSGRSAADRLKAARMALGLARGRSPGLSEAVTVLERAVAGMGKTLKASLGSAEDPGARATQVLVNLVLVAAEAWPRARILSLEAASGAFLVSAEGAGPLGAEWSAALAGTDEDGLDPRTVQAYLAGRLALGMGALVDQPPGRPGCLRLAVPPAAGG